MSAREDAGRHLLADAIMEDLRQFDKLRRVEPPLSVTELAHRMAWKVEDVQWLLKKMKDTRLSRNEEIWQLHELGKTYKEIAEKLSLTRSVVAGVVARTKERLRRG